MLQVFDDGSDEVHVLVVDETGCHISVAVAEILQTAVELAAGSASAMARSHLPISRGGGGVGAGCGLVIMFLGGRGAGLKAGIFNQLRVYPPSVTPGAPPSRSPRDHRGPSGHRKFADTL